MKRSLFILFSIILLTSSFATAQKINDIVVCNNKLFVATDEGVFNAYYKGKFLVRVPDMRKIGVSRIYVSGSSLMAYQNDYYMYYSVNSGKNWTMVMTGDVKEYQKAAAANGRMYVSTDKKKYVTDNGGFKWSKADDYPYSSEFSNPYVDNSKLVNFPLVNSLQASAILDSVIYAVANNVMYYSDDNGTIWNPCRNTKEEIAEQVKAKCSENPWWASKDYGVIDYLCYTSTPYGFYAGNKNGLFYKTQTNAVWSKISHSLENITFYTVVVKNKWLFAGTSNGIYKTENNGITWIPANEGIVFGGTDNSKFSYGEKAITSVVFNGEYIFASCMTGVYRSDNNGESWINCKNGLTETRVYALATCEGIIYAGTNIGIFISEDNGNTWKEFGSNKVDSNYDNYYNHYDEERLKCTRLVVYPQVIYAQIPRRVTGGMQYHDGGVTMSTDGGTTWSDLTTTYEESYNCLDEKLEFSIPVFMLLSLSATETKVSDEQWQKWEKERLDARNKYEFERQQQQLEVPCDFCNGNGYIFVKVEDSRYVNQYYLDYLTGTSNPNIQLPKGASVCPYCKGSKTFLKKKKR